MEQKQVGLITLGGLIALSVASGFTTYYMAGLDQSISKLIRISEQRKDMQTLQEDVQTSTGRTITVTTTRREDETAADFAKRHDEAVQAAKQL